MPIGDHQAHQAGEIVAMPVALHVRLAGAHRAGECDIRVEAGVAHTQGDIERRRRADAAEGSIQRGVDQAQAPVTYFAELRQQQGLCQPGQQRAALDAGLHVGCA
jgi:hypothetical protein